MPADVLNHLPDINVFEDKEAQRILEEHRTDGRSPGVLMLAQAAEAKGASTEWFGTYAAISHIDGHRFLFFGHKGTESHVSARIIFDKMLTKTLLQEAGVPTPHGIIVANPQEALRFRDEVGGPIVLKPRFGMKGRGVTVDLRGPKEIIAAFKHAAQFGEVLAEKYVPAAIDYRCFATDRECVSVVRRLLPWIAGDGTSTIAQLIDVKNVKRQLYPCTVGTDIPMDLRTRRYLKRSDLTLESVLPDRKTVVVRDVGGLSSGGEPYECSDFVTDEFKDTVARAVAAIPGLSWAGCDVLIGKDGVAQVIEVNSDAGIGGARYPYYGTPQPIDTFLVNERVRTAPDVATNSITPLPPLPSPIRLSSLHPDETQAGVHLPTLFHSYLRSQGWQLEEFAKGTARAVSPWGQVEWLRGCATMRDLDIVHRCVQRHAIVRGLLHSAGIMRPRGRMVTNRDDLREFFDTVSDQIKLVRFRRPWEAGVTRTVTSYEDIDNWPRKFRHRWIAQDVPRGIHCWVIASDREPLTILAGDDFPPELCAAASKVGVEAVRAIPELRWGAVAIVFRKALIGGRTALVEGVSIDPMISTDHSVVAGSLDNVWARVLAE